MKDLNQNSRDRDGEDITNGVEAGPDLPELEKPARDLFADGLKSDLKLNQDTAEETLSNPEKEISYQGINQRFGRKFKIIKFRWLNEMMYNNTLSNEENIKIIIYFSFYLFISIFR